MKTFILISVLITVIQTNIFAQEQKTTPVHFVQITTIESVISGGAGRSKMIITKDDGTNEEKDMENLFSLVGLNLKNIKQNESAIITTLKSYTDNGWKLTNVTPLTLSPGQSSNGIFMTRYLFTKEGDK